MTYKTTKAVRDTQDNDFCYYAGAIFPRQGLEVSKERLEMLVKNGYIVAVDDNKSEPAFEGVGEETEDDKVELPKKSRLNLMNWVLSTRAVQVKQSFWRCLMELRGNSHD